MANYGFQFKDKNGNNYYPCPFPVGFVVLTNNKVNPSTYWGGTWVQYYGGYIYAAQNSIGQTDFAGWNTQSKAAYNSGSTTLTIDQIPSHEHTLKDGVYSNNLQIAMRGDGGGSSGQVPSWNQTTSHSRIIAAAVGGGKGHVHSIGAHSHNIATIDVFAWKRTA